MLGSFEHSNKTSHSIKCDNILTMLHISNFQEGSPSCICLVMACQRNINMAIYNFTA